MFGKCREVQYNALGILSGSLRALFSECTALYISISARPVLMPSIVTLRMELFIVSLLFRSLCSLLMLLQEELLAYIIMWRMQETLFNALGCRESSSQKNKGEN